MMDTSLLSFRWLFMFTPRAHDAPLSHTPNRHLSHQWIVVVDIGNARTSLHAPADIRFAHFKLLPCQLGFSAEPWPPFSSPVGYLSKASIRFVWP